jgi:diguanylate cyclase (GGDEF)-like protein
MPLSSITLKFYRRLGRWLPFYSLGDKVCAAAFLAINLPLLAMLGFALANGSSPDPDALMLTLVATLAGSALALWALKHLLAPVRHAEHALQMYRSESRVLPLPTDLGDDMGQLLRDLRRMLETAEERRSQLDLLNFVDPLTGLPNRRNAENYLKLSSAASERAGGRLSVAMIDLDNYDEVVERLGTEGGDRALKVTGDFLDLWFKRKTDWMGRWSGSRFIAVVFADQPTTADYVANVGREFSRQMRSFDGHALLLASGVAEVRRHEDIHACVRRAAEALHASRRSAEAPELGVAVAAG